MARLTGAVRHVVEALGDLLYPPHCAACEVPLPAGLLCAPCRGALRPLAGPRCPRCGGPCSAAQAVCAACLRGAGALDGGTCYGVYREGRPLARLVQNLKYRGDRALVPPLGARLTQAARALPRRQQAVADCTVQTIGRARGFGNRMLEGGVDLFADLQNHVMTVLMHFTALGGCFPDCPRGRCFCS